MALGTFTNKNKFGLPVAVGDGYEVIVSFAADSSYPTNGSSIVEADLGFPTGVVFDFVSCPCAGGYSFEFDYANKKLKAYWQSDPAGGGGAPLALIEVTNTTNLSTTTVRLFAKASVR